MWDPSQGTVFNRRLMALLERSSATPVAAQTYWEWVLELDIEDVLPNRFGYPPGSCTSPNWSRA